MSKRNRPPLLVFDVNETLLDLDSLRPVFQRIFGDEKVMRAWFAQLILYSEAMTIAGSYSNFGELAAGVLRMFGDINDVDISDEDVSELKTAIGSMPALPDVAPSLEKLKSAGFRLVTLTNSPPGPSPTPLERAGIANFFEQSFSVDSVQRFKPAPETYHHVADKMEVELSDMCMVACHLWDTLGAQAAGALGALIRRPGNSTLIVQGIHQPDIIVDDMHAFADAAIGRWIS